MHGGKKLRDRPVSRPYRVIGAQNPKSRALPLPAGGEWGSGLGFPAHMPLSASSPMYTTGCLLLQQPGLAVVIGGDNPVGDHMNGVMGGKFIVVPAILFF